VLHWHHRLPAIVLVALTIALTSGKLDPLGFFW
jgi:hypothetical protein